jgi:type VI secretion system secreted protein VgrG
MAHGIQLGFITKTFPDTPNHLHLHGVRGREEISRLFELTLLLVSPTGPLTDKQLESIVSDPCAIALGPNPGDIVHGIITEIEHLDGTRFKQPRYRAKLMPYVALLAMAKRSAIYPTTTVPKLVAKILESYGLKAGTHFEFLESKTTKTPELDYAVQYQETDWDFISRWLEHEGYFYWFRHTKDRAVLVIAHANSDTRAIAEPSAIPYREDTNLANEGALDSIWDFHLSQRRIPSRVVAIDYNYRTPAKTLVAVENVDDAKGFGNVFTYGEHFKDVNAGKDIAKLRAERFKATQRVVSGVTDCARFRVGHRFELENHHLYEDKYLITKLEYRVGMDVQPTREALPVAEQPPITPYHGAFEAQPMGVPYRPERRTPWPRIYGFIQGHVEADSKGDFAQIDDQGRYKVKLPFDASTVQGLAASRWIRMAQAYSGSGYGIHYPLHKGTEVLISHVDGDPDRPVIVGSVPNPITPSPVTANNSTQSVIDTASSIRIELEDNQPAGKKSGGAEPPPATSTHEGHH